MIRLLLLLFLLTACNPIRPQSLELPPSPDRFSETERAELLSLNDRWWTAFNDPQLNRLQEQLVAGNLEFSQALYRLEQLQAAQKITEAGRWPTLSLNGSAVRSQTQAMTGASRSTTFQGLLNASYEVDLWNKLSDREKAAELRTRAGEQDTQALLLSLSAQLAEQYFTLIEQRLQLELLEQQTRRNTSLLDTVTDRYRAGLATSADYYRARQELIALQSREPQIKTAIASANHMLTVMLGQYPGSLSISSGHLPEPEDITGIGLPADLLSRRPDVAATLTALESADHDLAAALADRLPAINLSASLGRTLTRMASGDIEGTLWSLGFSLAQPLLDGGRREAESKRHEAIRAEKMIAFRIAILNAVKEVETALAAERNSASRSQILEQQLRVSEDLLQLTERNYRSGLTDSDSLLDQEIRHLDILSQQLSNRGDRISNRISLARALGGSWMAEELNKHRNSLTTAEDQPQ